MTKEMIISSSAHETRVAILEDDQVAEIFIERERSRGVVGNLYKGRVSKVLPGILAAIQRGEPFSQAVAQYPEHFSPLYVATIRASERTGNVREALGRYIAYQEELDKVRKKIVSATIYPAILAIVGALVMGFLMFYVVPRFAKVYEDMAGTLPFFSPTKSRPSGANAIAVGKPTFVAKL